MNTEKGQEMYKRAKQLIPGGTQLLSKRPEMFLPEQWPSYYREARGVKVVDLDGNEYADMSYMGIGSCTLGYADPDVNAAVKKVIDESSMCTLNSPEEVELAEKLMELHPWADQVRYARTGGEAMAVAQRIGRAKSKRDKIAICGYHGWHDWYLACNISSVSHLDAHLLTGLAPNGVPKQLADTTLAFNYNDIDSLKNLVKRHNIGTIVVEPFRHEMPKEGFLKEVRKIASEIGAVLIFDEITCGWRNNLGGIHLEWGIDPDIVVYAKGMSNGFPMAAILGRREIMEAAQESFISSTYWTERIGPAAALATIKKMEAKKVQDHIKKIGNLIWKGWESAAKETGLKIKVVGPPSLVTFSFDDAHKTELKTLFTQEMLKRGYLAAQSVYVCYAHDEATIQNYMTAVKEVFALLQAAIVKGDITSRLEGPLAHTGFKRLVD
ncbi:aminotransferase class III-fold pyridoxal phosphate-dependent enzyme [Candidatus Woesearchaeota archaeon]|nr:aminotransferase class III-fold pyridoxal phosphate-dependent enzyme [Candidatus Woesearchaeota archaeon]